MSIETTCRRTPGEALSLKGLTPENWLCIDCGADTAPGCHSRLALEAAFATQGLLASGKDEGVDYHITSESEIYTVRTAVWSQAGMEPMGGCLCIGCLEKRLGRKLKPKDFLRGHAFNDPAFPCTPRLLKRRGTHQH